MHAYIKLLRTHTVVRKLTMIQFIAYMGAWFSMVAVYVLAHHLGATPMQIAFIAIMSFLPGIIQAPLVGVVIDKVRFKPLMLTLLVVEFCATAGLLFIDDISVMWLLFVLLFMRMSAASFYFASEMSLLPHFLHAKELKLANEIHSIIWSLTYTAGMALGGVVVTAYGVYTAIVVDLLFFVVAFGILVTVKVPHIIKTASGSVWYEIKSGLRYIIDNKKVLYLMILHASVGLTAYDALIALLADVLYKELIAIALSIGIINAVRAVGLTLGPLVIGRFIHPNNLDIVMFLQGIFILIWGVMQPWFYLSLVAVFFTGVLTTSIWSLSYAMLQEATDKNFLGRVMSYNEMLFMSMSVLGSFLIGYLFDSFGFSLQEVTYTLGTLFILMSIYYRLIKRLVV